MLRSATHFPPNALEHGFRVSGRQGGSAKGTKAFHPRPIATYKQFPVQVQKGVFENLDRYELDPKQGRSLDA